MSSLRILTAVTLMGFSINSLFGQNEENKEMDGAGLETIVRELSEDNDVTVNPSVIQFSFEGVPLYCIYDETHNRMRIISPIFDYSLISEAQKDLMMKSNFHAALDTRYCVSDDVLYAAFIHPLSTLQRGEVLSAIYQVASLHLSFGTGYTSGLLTFGGEEETKEEEKDPI